MTQELTPREATAALLQMRARKELATPRHAQPGEPRRSAAGPTSRAVKLKDPALTAMINAAVNGKKAAKPEVPMQEEKDVSQKPGPSVVEGVFFQQVPPEQSGLPELERLYTAWKAKCIVGEPLVEIPNRTVLVDPAGRILIELRHLIDLLKEQRP